jgi:branched-chain amino acid transport system substrate-binding protein
VATVSPLATRVSLANNGWDNFFRVVADDGVQGPADADYAVKKLKATKIYVVDDATAYGSGLASAFATQATADKATVTTATVPGTSQCQNGTASTTQYSSAATAAKASGATLLFYGGYDCDLWTVHRCVAQRRLQGHDLLGDGSLDPHYISGTSPASATNGAILSCACTTVTDKNFISGFTQLAKFAPGTYSARPTTPPNTIIAAIKGLPAVQVQRANIVTALHKITYKGLTKPVKFASNGNISGSAIYVSKVVCGAGAKANTCAIGPRFSNNDNRVTTLTQ